MSYETRRSRSEFETTETELKDIASAAIIGSSKPNAARGTPIEL